LLLDFRFEIADLRVNPAQLQRLGNLGLSMEDFSIVETISKSKIQNPKSKIQNPKSKIQNPHLHPSLWKLG